MIRYTDCTLDITFSGLEVIADKVIISIVQGRYRVEKIFKSVDMAKTLSVSLSQEETGGFNPGKVRVQANIIYDGRSATTIGSLTVSDNLYCKAVPEGSNE